MSCRLTPDPRRARAGPRSGSLRLAGRARLHENPRGNPNTEVIPLPTA